MIWSLLAWWQRLFFHIIRKQPSYLNPTHGITIFINKSVKSLTDQKCQQRASSYLKLVGFLISHLQHGQHSRPKTVGFNKTRNHNFFRSLASKSPIYSLDPNFAAFLLEDTTWLRKTSSSPLRRFENDGEDVLEANRRYSFRVDAWANSQLLPGYFSEHNRQEFHFCKRNMASNSCPLWLPINWSTLFLDFNNIRLQPDERPEDLYQRILSFIDDSSLKAMQ